MFKYDITCDAVISISNDDADYFIKKISTMSEQKTASDLVFINGSSCSVFKTETHYEIFTGATKLVVTASKMEEIIIDLKNKLLEPKTLTPHSTTTIQ